jgi:hypothetical protein
MLGKVAIALVLAAMVPVICACTAEPAATGGDCNARVRYDGVVYRPHNELSSDPPPGARLGMADVIGCGDADSASVVDRTPVFMVSDVAASVAIMVDGDEWQGIYVAEGVPPSKWPGSTYGNPETGQPTATRHEQARRSDSGMTGQSRRISRASPRDAGR